MDAITFKFIEEPEEDLCEEVNSLLRTYNQTMNPIFWEAFGKKENQPKPLKIFAFGNNRELVGGLLASTRLVWLKIDILAIREELRGRGIGKALLERAEAIACERGCRYVYTDTMEYQAPGFYQKAGYNLAGILDDWDSHGHKKFLFTKEL